MDLFASSLPVPEFCCIASDVLGERALRQHRFTADRSQETRGMGTTSECSSFRLAWQRVPSSALPIFGERNGLRHRVEQESQTEEWGTKKARSTLNTYPGNALSS